jgi:hypothetical protein
MIDAVANGLGAGGAVVFVEIEFRAQTFYEKKIQIYKIFTKFTKL